MTQELEVETYLTIQQNKFCIYLLNKKKMSILYKEELNFEENAKDLVLKNLSKFLDENIFKVEKLLGNFINNIFVIIDVDKIFNIDVSLKKKKL